MGGGPAAARRRDGRPGREGCHLVGAAKPCRCASGAAHHDRLVGVIAVNALRQALAPYVLGGAHGKLLDADHDRLGMADVQGFEMEELMHSPAAVQAVLRYLFARFDERFDGAPTLLILDEAWLFLDEPSFAARIRQWLKTLRKRTSASSLPRSRWPTSRTRPSRQPSSKAARAGSSYLTRRPPSQIRTIYEGFGEQPPD